MAKSQQLFIQRRPALLAHPNFAIPPHIVPNTNRATGRTNQLHVGQRNPAFLLRDPTFDVALRVRPHVLLHHHHVLHQKLVVAWKHAQHAPFLALVPPRDHLHGVVAADIHSLMCRRCNPHKNSPYRTSGANETIFKNFFSRSSRATGPNTRVPTGSPASLISTAAF